MFLVEEKEEIIADIYTESMIYEQFMEIEEEYSDIILNLYKSEFKAYSENTIDEVAINEAIMEKLKGFFGSIMNRLEKFLNSAAVSIKGLVSNSCKFYEANKATLSGAEYANIQKLVKVTGTDLNKAKEIIKKQYALLKAGKSLIAKVKAGKEEAYTELASKHEALHKEMKEISNSEISIDKSILGKLMCKEMMNVENIKAELKNIMSALEAEAKTPEQKWFSTAKKTYKLYACIANDIVKLVKDVHSTAYKYTKAIVKASKNKAVDDKANSVKESTESEVAISTEEASWDSFFEELGIE